MGVDHGRFDVLVSQQLLHRADIVAVFQQVGGEGVAQGVAGAVFDYARGVNRPADRALDGVFENVVPTGYPGSRIDGEVVHGEYPMPSPRRADTRELALQRKRRFDARRARLSIALPEASAARDLLLQRHREASRQHRPPVFVAFGFTHQNLAAPCVPR